MENIEPFNTENLELEIMELPVSDIQIENGVAEIYTEKTDFIQTRQEILNLGYHITESDLHYFADTTINLSGEDKEKFQKIIEMLEEDDDIDNVYHNANLS
jgi:transcriptional/translational regulatory protein YebC/TACO1